MRVAIFGLGYVGCVSAGCLAQGGHSIIGVDTNQIKVDLINAGKATIIEKDIDTIIAEQSQAGRIVATTNACEAVWQSDVGIVCVGTPSLPSGQLDLKYVIAVCEQIADALREKNGFYTIVIRSTVLPGTNRRATEIIRNRSGKIPGEDFAVMSNPEFLREGSAVRDYFEPAYTLIGGDSDKGFAVLGELYRNIDSPFEKTDIEVAEIMKYLNNTFHALKVTFANEVGSICKELHIDSHKAMAIFVKDTRLNISPYYLKPGFAYGGSCLPKDARALRTLARDLHLETPVINSIESSNEINKQIALRMVMNQPSRKVGILGLSFKSGTDDLRNSPALEITEGLFGKGYSIKIWDEHVQAARLIGANLDFLKQHLPHLEDLITDNLFSVVEFADTLVITHDFRGLAEIVRSNPTKHFIDLVRIRGLESFPRNYEGIGW